MSGTRRLGLAATAAFLLLVALPAGAQESESVTSLEPLQKIIDSFGAGESAGGLVGPGAPGSESVITSQFQFLVNQGSSAAFGEGGNEFIPTGLAPGDGVELVSLEEQFGGRIKFNDWFPPLDPWTATFGTRDIGPLFEGWTAYGDQGVVDGPANINETPSVVWGMELSEPFDESCSGSYSVGRSWVSSRSPEFTAEALIDFFGDSLSPLAVGNSRLLQLSCGGDGFEPRMSGHRMTDDKGIQGFSPTGTVAMVKGNRIVFFSPMRIFDEHLQPFFYATPPGGGPVVVSETSGDIRALLPNPYGDLPVRIDLVVDIVEAEAEALGAPIRAQTLLHQPGQSATLRAGTGCGPKGTSLFVEDLILGAGASGRNRENIFFFLRDQSVGGRSAELVEGGSVLSYDVQHPDGSTEAITINLLSQTFEAEVTEPDQQPCNSTGTATVTGAAIADSGNDDQPASSDDDQPAADGGQAPPADATAPTVGASTDQSVPTDGGGNALVWASLSVLAILLFLVLYWWFGWRPKQRAYRADRWGDLDKVEKEPEPPSKPDEPLVLEGEPVDAEPGIVDTPDPVPVATRTGSKDCIPEQQAYAAARQRREAADGRRDAANAAFDEANSRLTDIKIKVQNEPREPNRSLGYPPGLEGTAAYETDAAQYQQDLADYEAAQGELAAAQAAVDEAQVEVDAALAERNAAWDAENAARRALDACMGRATGDWGGGVGGGVGGGGVSGPGTVTDPDDQDSGCPKGDIRFETEPGLPRERFTILGGTIRVVIDNAPATWTAFTSSQGNRHELSAATLLGLDRGQVEDLMTDPTATKYPTPRASIETKTISLKCLRVFRCDGATYVKTDETQKDETVSSTDTETFGGKPVSEASHVADFIDRVKERVEELQANEAAARAFACD